MLECQLRWFNEKFLAKHRPSNVFSIKNSVYEKSSIEAFFKKKKISTQLTHKVFITSPCESFNSLKSKGNEINPLQQPMVEKVLSHQHWKFLTYFSQEEPKANSQNKTFLSSHFFTVLFISTPFLVALLDLIVQQLRQQKW